MSQSRKFCLYKGCDNQPGRTMFRFPTDKERFRVWVQNAGLELKGDVNVSEYRYLCEKHFSSKYVSNQSRRKMLVHTAVPEKWNNEEAGSVEFTIVGQPAEKKRKSQFSSRESLENIQVTTQPAIILNNQKRKLEDSTTSNEETIEMIESDGGSVSVNHDIVYEEVIIPPNKKSFKCVVVKQKKLNSPAKSIINYTQPTTSSDQVKEEDTFFLTEEGNISSTNVEQKDEIIEEEEVQPATTYSKKTTAVENYSEFIFNGEIYVQMPKRIFEAEKEKIRGESSKYKAMLVKLKKQIDELLEN